MTRYVASHPYPYNGDPRPGNTTAIVVDMQPDFSGSGVTLT